MKVYRRKISALLAVGMILSNLLGVLPVQAAPSQVEVDESMYVNLDFYGGPGKINVVKGVKLNGNSQYIDYGNYKSVINMSNEAIPKTEGDAVTWAMPAEVRQFYCKYGLDPESIILPWHFDISYRLNGVPVNAEQLRGASGLVDIRITATPDRNAPEYYRSNMMLVVAVPVDFSKCYSVEAEGSQTQAMGETTAVVFSALPGETGDYRVEIGTDSFETTGILMSMIPGTVDALNRIKDINEAKNTWRASGDLLYDSMEAMLKSMEAMRSDIGTIEHGMRSAETARQQWSREREHLLAGNDDALASLNAVAKQTEKMIPYLTSAKEQADIVNRRMKSMTATAEGMQNHLEDLRGNLEQMEYDMDRLSDRVDDLILLDGQLQNDIREISAALQNLINNLPNATPSNAVMPSGLEEIAGLLGSLQDKMDRLSELGVLSGNLIKSLSGLSSTGGDALDNSGYLVDDMADLLDGVTGLYHALDTYYPDMQAALTDTQMLLSSSTSAMNSTTQTLELYQGLLRDSSGYLDHSAYQSLTGAMALMDKSLGSLDSVAAIREAGSEMKGVMDRELDKMESENNFLEMDPSAAKVSFTSSKNGEPKTLQIILRTDEISMDDAKEDQIDLEVPKVKVSPFVRMWNVICETWKSAVGVFKNR